MSRRYLTPSEAESALRRGKSVECFIGPFERNGEKGVRWLSIRNSQGGVSALIYESADIGNEDFLDIYAFGPLDPDLDFEDAAETIAATSFREAISIIEKSFPNVSSRIVNEGIVQDEYADFIAGGCK